MATRGYPVNNARPEHGVPRSSGQGIKQYTFAWKMAEKFKKLCNFEIEVREILMTNSYNKQKGESPSNTEPVRPRRTQLL